MAFTKILGSSKIPVPNFGTPDSASIAAALDINKAQEMLKGLTGQATGLISQANALASQVNSLASQAQNQVNAISGQLQSVANKLPQFPG